MTFPSSRTTVISTIHLRVVTTVNPDTSVNSQYTAEIDTLDAGGNGRTIALNLLPYLTAGQKTALDGFMATLRVKAATELLV